MLRRRNQLVALLICGLLLPIQRVDVFAQQDDLQVSPGKFDFKLGKDFDKFEDRVKLEYPKSTIFMNSVGELLFKVTLTSFKDSTNCFESSIRKSITIYVPPEFQFLTQDTSSVWTSYTNDYNTASVFLGFALPNDPIAPFWQTVTISNLIIVSPAGITPCNPSGAIPEPLNPHKTDVSRRIFVSDTPQFVRLFNIKAPSIVGRYFFKMFVCSGIGLQAACLGTPKSIGANNFPTIVVKGDLNPAFISGTVRYGDLRNSKLYFRPLDRRQGTLPFNFSGGKVFADGFSIDGRHIQGQAFFNSTANGHYTIYGLPPGTYNLTAQASGYPPQLRLPAVSLLEGQSLDGVDILLRQGANINGTVFSKHGFGEVPWGFGFKVINSFNATQVKALQDCANQAVSPAPPPLDASGFTLPALQDCRKTFAVQLTTFPNDAPLPNTPLPLQTGLPFQPVRFVDPRSSKVNFNISFIQWDGHIPTDFGAYISGIPSGDYYVKPYVVGYVQMEPTVAHVINQTTTVFTDIDLQKSSFFNVTIHFHNYTGDRVDSPIPSGGVLYLEARSPDGVLQAFNFTFVPKGTAIMNLSLSGIDVWHRFSSAALRNITWGFARDAGFLPGTYIINAYLFGNVSSVDFVALSATLSSGRLGQIFSSQTLELSNRETPLYFQRQNLFASITLSNSPIEVSAELVKGGGFNLTIFSVDYQNPTVPIPWAHPGQVFRVDIFDANGILIQTLRNITQPALPVNGQCRGRTAQPIVVPTSEIPNQCAINIDSFDFIGLKAGTYYIRLRTLGYLETELFSIPVQYGEVSNRRINLLRGAAINVTMVFKTEERLDPIDNNLTYAEPINHIDATPVRVEVFNSIGEFKGANITYVGRGSNTISITVDGFGEYFGDPSLQWTNFYDTTNGKEQFNEGLSEDTYLIRVRVAGYYQFGEFRVNLISGTVTRFPEASVVFSLERLTRVSGNVTWYTSFSSELFPLSWGGVSAVALDGTNETITYYLDGFYLLWLPKNTYLLGASHPGLVSQSTELAVPWGSLLSEDFYLFEVQRTSTQLSMLSHIDKKSSNDVASSEYLATAAQQPRAWVRYE